MTDERAQESGWLRDITLTRQSAAFAELSSDGLFLLDTFEAKLHASQGTSKRSNIVTPFTKAVKDLLRRRGLVPDPSARAVTASTDLIKTADISFQFDGRPWIIEIKTGIEFNAFAAATLEGLAYKAQLPDCRFLLLALYAKNIKGDLRDVLTACKIPHAIDDVLALSNNRDTDTPTWCRNLICGLNSFAAILPNGER